MWGRSLSTNCDGYHNGYHKISHNISIHLCISLRAYKPTDGMWETRWCFFFLPEKVHIHVCSLSLSSLPFLVCPIYFCHNMNMDPGQPGDMCLDMSVHILESPKLACLSSKGDRTVPSIDFPTGRFPKRNTSKIRGTASQKKSGV